MGLCQPPIKQPSGGSICSACKVYGIRLSSINLLKELLLWNYPQVETKHSQWELVLGRQAFLFVARCRLKWAIFLSILSWSKNGKPKNISVFQPPDGSLRVHIVFLDTNPKNSCIFLEDKSLNIQPYICCLFDSPNWGWQFHDPWWFWGSFFCQIVSRKLTGFLSGRPRSIEAFLWNGWMILEHRHVWRFPQRNVLVMLEVNVEKNTPQKLNLFIAEKW